MRAIGARAGRIARVAVPDRLGPPDAGAGCTSPNPPQLQAEDLAQQHVSERRRGPGTRNGTETNVSPR